MSPQHHPDDPIDSLVEYLDLALQSARLARFDVVAQLIKMALLEVALVTSARVVKH